ncbi:MAG: O-succinylbenzoic acid--CoA ligase [Saprospiraceae bacterium]|jgi:O-succinylbenzoic acid--CoA ligase
MKQDSSTLKVLKLDFEKFSEEALIEIYTNVELPTWAREVIDFLKYFIDKKEVSCFTSGTTGAPKRSTFTKDQLTGGAQNTLNYFGLSKGDSALLPLSCSHIAGKMMLIRALVGELKLTVIEPSSNLDAVINDLFDFSVVVPMQIQSCLLLNDKEALERLGKILIGGSEISDTMVLSLIELEIQAWSSFGMTETMSHFALRQLSPREQKNYTCLKGFEISNHFKGQLKLENKELGILELQTTDVVKVFPDGSFNWLGRADNVVNSGGVKLFPELIEQKIKRLFEDLPEFIIVGVPDSKLGQKLVLFHEGNSFLSAEEQMKLQSQLLKYECPKDFMFIQEFEKTRSGKIVRKNYT